MKRTVVGLLGAGVATGLVLWAAGPAQATLDLQKKAKAAGFEATNCLYCHNEKLPKKGAVSHNDRGKWLLSQKEAKSAKEIDVAWLKEFAAKK